jgi:thiamine transport system permease protein
MRRRWLEQVTVPLGVILTVAVLSVVFYYPVGSVFVEAIVYGGQLSLVPLLDVLSDPFYTGVLHHLFVDPLGVPQGIVAWLGAGAPTVSFGLFGFTTYQALLSTVASVLLGLPGAYLLSRYEFRGRRTIRALTILPFVLPAIMVAVGFQAMFSQQGLLSDLLRTLGFGSLDLLFTLELIVLAHAFYNAPLVTRLVTAAWESVDVRRVETARAMGASRSRAFRDVVLPELLPSLLTASLLTFIFTFMSFPIVLALGGLRLATVEVWIFARVQSLELAEASTLAAIETVLSLLLMYVYLRYEARQTAGRSGGTSLSRRPFWTGWNTLSDSRRVGLLAYGLVAVVVFVGPLASMVIESVTGPNGTFTTAYYEFLLNQQASTASGTTRPLPAITNSLLFGAGTLLLAVPMGVVVSVVATRDAFGSRIAESILTAPLAVSGIVVGLGLLQTLVFGTVLFDYRITVFGPLAIVLAHTVAAYPFVTRNVAPALGGLDPRLADSARSLGATRIRALLDVELPLIAAAVTAGAAFAFAISIGEFDSTVLLSSNVDRYTMPVALERYSGNRSLGPNLGPATAMGTVLLVITAASFVVIDRVGGRWEL